MLESKKLKGIIFDLDGTLVDSLGVTFDGFNHAITTLGKSALTPQEIMVHFGTGEDRIFAKLVGEIHAPRAYGIFRQYMDDHMGRVPLHAGVADLLSQVKQAGIPTSIFTGRSWATTEIILKHHGILDQFITVVANDHVGAPKPSPEGLYLALSRMGLQANEVLFVGDSPADMIASRAADSHGVAALWDLLAQKEALEPCEPVYWASHPKEIWSIWNATQAN